MATQPSFLRRATALAAIFALFVSSLIPLTQAAAAPSGAGTLLAAICSPNGVRYVEMDLGAAGREVPPPQGALDHCPGCLGAGASALLPVVVTVWLPLGGDPIVPGSRDQAAAARTETSFRPRAPPSAG